MRVQAPGNQRELFGRASELPSGMRHRAEFLTPSEERELLVAVGALPLEEARYKAFTAKRRIASFGFGYDFAGNALTPAPPLPPFLQALRRAVSAWSGIAEDALVQATVAEYRPGTRLGWHRDVPHFGMVVGISLGAPCRMRLRPYPHRAHGGDGSCVLVLEPRSAYVLADDARWRWQHAISPTKSLRHSITFRTLRRR